MSLGILDAAFVGAATSDWPAVVQRLERMGLCDAATTLAVHQRWWFGRLIADTDMHAGNLSLRPRATGRGAVLDLAPAYDMLPMGYAALPGGEVLERRFAPALAAPSAMPAWLRAADAARPCWEDVAGDPRVSDPFRRIAETNAARVAGAAAALG